MTTEIIKSERTGKYNYGVVFAIPSRTGMVSADFFLHMNQVTAHMPVGVSWKYIFVKNKPVDQARERCIELAMREKAKYIFFIDDDTFIPYDAVIRLMRHQKPVVTGIVWTKRDPTEPVIFKEVGMGPYYDFPKDKLVPIESGGLACCMIQSDVFEKLERPWFKMDWAREHEGEKVLKMKGVGEDLYFYQKCKNAKIPVYADTSVLCDHMDLQTGRTFPGSEVVDQYINKEEKMWWKLKHVKTNITIISDSNSSMTERCVDMVKVNSKLMHEVYVVEKTEDKQPYFGIDRLIVPEGDSMPYAEIVNNVKKDSSGHYMVFMKNNVMVKDHWLRKMIDQQQTKRACIVYDSPDRNIMLLPHKVIEDNGEYNPDYEKLIASKGGKIVFVKDRICEVIK